MSVKKYAKLIWSTRSDRQGESKKMRKLFVLNSNLECNNASESIIDFSNARSSDFMTK